MSHEAKILEYIAAALAKGTLRLPKLPDVALRLREAVQGGDASDGELAAIVAQDPSLAARLLHVVNSPAYRPSQPVMSLQSAIARLGRSAFDTFVTSLALREMFIPTNKVLERYFSDVWKNSVNVAATSQVLASGYPHLHKEQAMLAGLVHQIGKLPVLALAENRPELLERPEILERLLDRTHLQIGRMAMEHWHFPEAIGRAAWEYRSLDRDPGERADYVDLVQVAWIEREMHAGNVSFPQLSEIGAFRRLGLKPEIEVLESESFAQEVAEITVMYM